MSEDTPTNPAFEIRQQLDQVERTIESGTYRTGDWQKCLGNIRELEQGARSMLSMDLTRISNKLHRLNKFPEAPAWAGFLLEFLLFIGSISLISTDNMLEQLVGIVLLALCLQPLIKITTGFLLGVRYAYVYLWYVEPRFKMQFGTYHRLDRWKKIVLQSSGSIGTPIALYIGWLTMIDKPIIGPLLLVATITIALMQITAFAAVCFGVRKVGPFLLANLTTPALLAQEIRYKQ